MVHSTRAVRTEDEGFSIRAETDWVGGWGGEVEKKAAKIPTWETG